MLDEILNDLVTIREKLAVLTPSRELSLAVTKVDEAIMWTSAARTIETLAQDVTNAQAVNDG